jgi:hypothetical protein
MAAEEGRNERLEKAEAGEIPFDITHKLVMPEEYEARQGVTNKEDVIDLRPVKKGASVRFASPKTHQVE